MNTVSPQSVRIESDDLAIASLFKDFYCVPDFQREYVWQTEQVEKLLNDIYDEFYDERGLVGGSSEYFIGSIVVCQNASGTFELIDGQQRMTTIFLILCSIRDALMACGTDSRALAEMIRSVSADARTGEDVAKFRLTLQYEDSHDILETIASRGHSALGPRSATTSMKNIRGAYQDVVEFLTVQFGGDAAKLKEFFAAFTQRVKLIRIITPSLTTALKVFETINDRGIGLNAMDLLKNLLFMRTSSSQYPKLKARWKELVDTIDGCGEKPLRFLRYLILSHYETDTSAKLLREDEVYAWFANHSNETGIDKDPIEFISFLVARAKAYANFTRFRHASGTPNRYLRNMALLSGAAKQHFVLLLAACDLPPDLFEELTLQIENLLFVYLVTREPAKNFERPLAKWSKALRTVSSRDSLKAFIEQNIRPDIWSRTNAFDFAFGELSMVRIQQYRMRYILAKLTQFIEERAWENVAHASLDHYISPSVHIEHILSQTPTDYDRKAFDRPNEYDEYVQRLGNLTLLEKTINTSVSNGSFELKTEGYYQSAFLLTRSIVEVPKVGLHTQLNTAVKDLIPFQEWTSQSIEQRQAMLGRLARRVWGLELEES